MRTVRKSAARSQSYVVGWIVGECLELSAKVMARRAGAARGSGRRLEVQGTRAGLRSRLSKTGVSWLAGVVWSGVNVTKKQMK